MYFLLGGLISLQFCLFPVMKFSLLTKTFVNSHDKNFFITQKWIPKHGQLRLQLRKVRVILDLTTFCILFYAKATSIFDHLFTYSIIYIV